MKNTPLLLGTLLSIMMLTGAGCSSGDTDLVLDFLKEWGRSRGVLDDKGGPTAGAIWYAATGGSTGDPQADAAIDAGLIVKSVKDTDKKLADADVALAKNPPDYTVAGTKINSAIQARPNDWVVRNHKAMYMLETGSSMDQAGPYLSSRSSYCNLNTTPLPTPARLESCDKQSYAQLEAITHATARATEAHKKPRCGLLQAQIEAYSQIDSINRLQHYDDFQSDHMWMISMLREQINDHMCE